MAPNKIVIKELANALAYWLPDKEPLLFQHDHIANAHKQKYWEAMRLLECVRGEYGINGREEQ